jgi:ABC-2 type transport system permease protein
VWLRAILTFVVPSAFITTVSAAVIIGRLNAEFVLFAVIVTALLFARCAAFWRFALRHYSRAGS